MSDEAVIRLNLNRAAGIFLLTKRYPTMITYEYRCQACGEEFSRMERMSAHADAAPHCPKCKSDRVQQIFRSIAVKTSRKS